MKASDHRCNVCGHGADPFGSGRVLGRYTVSFYRCGSCGFVQSEQPYWLDEAYVSAINVDDVGLLDRCIKVTHVVHALVSVYGGAGGTYCDFGGGYGVLTRLLRDRGLDFRHFDTQCENLFARDHEADLSRRYDLVTAVEVLEHMPAPLDGFSELTALSDHIFCTTTVQPSPPKKPGDWWYYSLEGGQHVSLHTVDSLRALGQKHGMHLTTDCQSLHFFTRGPVPAYVAWVVKNRRVAAAAAAIARRRQPVKSLLEHDAERLLAVGPRMPRDARDAGNGN